MKKILLIIILLGSVLAKAQNAIDLYEFSSVIYQGTAKSAAMGNAIGAVGQDFSAISINPASLGLFRRSSFVFTPALYLSSTVSKYQGSNGDDRAIKMPINNIGLTWTSEINDGSLKSVSFALGMNRTNNYTFNSYLSGDNRHTSLVDAYFSAMEANNINSANDLYDFSPNNLYPLWYTYVIDSIAPDYYTTYVPAGGLNQQRGVVKRGKANELSFSAGFNFNEKWFLGIGLNVPHFNRDMTTEYKETNLYPDEFRNWSQQEVITSSGWGVNAKIGVIVFPVKWLRLGATFHTPTIYRVDESWYTKTFSRFNNNSYSYQSEIGTYTYTLTTPYRLGANAAVIFGNFGMITADYEYIDYTNIRASTHDYNFTHLNNDIDARFNSTSNIRIGTEWRYQNLCFRGGYAFYGSPYGFNDDRLRTNSYSCGLGYTYHDFTIDLAYVLSRRTNTYQLYSEYTLYPAVYHEGDQDVVDDTKVKETTNINQLVVSFKFRLD